MKIALEVWSSDFAQVLDTCCRAEALGIDAFYYGEAPTGLNLDCWTTLAALAQRTQRIRLGPVITNVLGSYRGAVLLGKQAATVAIVSDGRLDFRTGVGASVAFGRPWWEPFGVEYPDYDRRLHELRQALSLLRPFWRGEPVEFSPAQPVTIGLDPPPIPVTVAATGPRGLALAGEFADTWETSFRTAAEVVTQREELAALGGVASSLTSSLTSSLEIDAFIGTTRSAVDSILRRANSERQGEDLDAVFERALLGTPDVVAEQLAVLGRAGVDQVVVALHDPHDPDALEALAQSAERLS